MKFSIFFLIFTFLNIFLGSEVTKKNHLKENFPIPSDEIPKDVYIVGNAKDEVLNLLKKNEGGFDYIHFFENHTQSINFPN